MQICTHCGSDFRRKDIVKSIWLKRYGPIQCPDCDMEYVIDFASRIRISLAASALPLGIFYFLNMFTDIRLTISLIIYLTWLIIISYFFPSIVKYRERPA